MLQRLSVSRPEREVSFGVMLEALALRMRWRSSPTAVRNVSWSGNAIGWFGQTLEQLLHMTVHIW